VAKIITCPNCRCAFPEDATVAKEIPMKEWLSREAEKHSVNENTIWYRLKRQPQKYYPTLKLRRVNQRVVFVQV